MANPISLTARLQNALNQSSLSLRCHEVSQILNEVSSKDANYILRVVIESIFGVTTDVASATFHNSNQQLGGGWGLKVITLGEHRIEFEALRSFLAPNGPLLSLVYKLAHDPFQLLPFPVSCLPARIKSEIEDGTAGLFYSSKVQTLGPGKVPANIMLNAFEFYIFHFAYFLLNINSNHWNLVWMAANESLYPTLLEDYLVSFLPCDASIPPGPPTTPVSPRGMLSTISQRSMGLSPYPSNPQLHLSSIVSPIQCVRSPDVHNYHYDVGGGMQTSSPVNPTQMYGGHQSQTDLNIWTTQVVSQVLLEMWIISCVPSPSKQSSNVPPTQHSSTITSSHPTLYNGANTTYTGYYPDLNVSFHSDFTPVEYRPYWQEHMIQNVFLPSSDHVRVVRILIKHFHYFSNSIKPNQPSPLDNLRRTLWPMCRRNLYLFLKHLFLHWPLDSSFRLVLETWVSYIQPWRYSTLKPKSPLHSPTPNEPVGSVAKHWFGFLCENLLFYSNLFLLFLRRIQRLDLAAPKNAHIVFRVSKVFSQDLLITMIQEVEESFEGGLQMQKSFLSLSTAGLQTNNSPNSQSTDLPPHTMSQLVRQHILEVEGQNFQFISTMNQQVSKEITQLTRMIKSALDAINAELSITSDQQPPQSISQSRWFFDAVKSLFDSPVSKESETTQEEMQRSVTHLEFSMNAFCRIFGISIPSGNLSLSADPHHTLLNESVLNRTPEKIHCPDQVLTENGPMLTQLGRHQLITGMRRLDLKYMGDPDLQPICSNEFGPLVRMLYTLASKINIKYERDIVTMFYRQDFCGRLSRVFLMPPQTVYEYPSKQTIGIRRRVAVDLAPRISLRFLANSHMIFALLICYFFIWLFGGSFLKFGFQFLFPFIFCYVAYKVIMQGSSEKEPLRLNVDPNLPSSG